MAAGAEAQGVDRLVDSLASGADQLTHLDDAAAKAGAFLVRRGEESAPRRTGYLATHHAAVVNAGQLEVTNSADYAAIVHARNPWLVRELEANEDRIVNIYADQVADVVAHIEGN